MFPSFDELGRVSFKPTLTESMNWAGSFPTTNTLQNCLEFIKLCYTKESWRFLVDKFEEASNHREAWIKIIEQKLLGEIPLEYVAFMYPYFVGRNGIGSSEYRVYFYFPQQVSGNEVWWDTTYFGVTITPAGNIEVADSAISRLKRYITQNWNPFLTTPIHRNYMFAQGSNSQMYLLRFFTSLFNFYTNGKCLAFGGTIYSRSQISDLFPQNLGRMKYVFTNRSVAFDCTVEINYETRSQLYHVFNYSAKIQQYLPYVIREKDDAKTANVYGVELEASTAFHPSNIIDAQNKRLFMFCKSDSSISGSKPHAMELVTVPATLRSHRKLWTNFFKRLGWSDKQWDNSTRTNNGMHIHCSRKNFTGDNHQFRFCWWFGNPEWNTLNYEVSERHSRDSFTQYAQYPSASGRNAISFRTDNEEALADTARRVYEWFRSVGHRALVNPQGSKTIEVRLFRGIISPATVLKNLEYVDSLTEWTRAMTSYREVTLQSYLEFLSSNKAQYGNILAFFEGLDIQTMRVEAELLTVINSHKHDPRKIAKGVKPIIDKYNLGPSAVHLLNALMQSKCFYWDSLKHEVVGINSHFARLIEHEDKAIADFSSDDDAFETSDMEAA